MGWIGKRLKHAGAGNACPDNLSLIANISKPSPQAVLSKLTANETRARERPRHPARFLGQGMMTLTWIALEPPYTP
jgi:hypothetical protein